LLGSISASKHSARITRYSYTSKPNNGLERIAYKMLTAAGDAVNGYSTRTTELRDARGWPVVVTNAVYAHNAWVDYETLNQVYNSGGKLTSRTRHDLSSGQTRVLLQQEWDGPLLTRRIDDEGVATSYEYYPGTKLVKEQRREAIAAQGAFPAQPEIVTSYTGSFIINAKQIPVWQKRITTITSAGSTLTEEHTYDADDRVILHKDFNGYSTTTVYSDMDKVVTETLPDLSERITTKNSKGLVLSITGTAVVPQYFHYEPLPDGGESKTVYTGQDEGPRYETTIKDNLKRISRVIKPAFGGGTEVTDYSYSLTHPNSVTQVTSSGQASRICGLNSLGVCERLGHSADDATLSLDSATDRITDTSTSIEQDANGLWKVTRKRVYNQENSDATKILITSRVKLGGFTGNEVARRETVDIAGNVTTSLTLLSGTTREERVSRPGVTGDEISVYQADRLTQVFSPGISDALTIGYDGFGREVSRKQPRHTQPSWTNYTSDSNLVASQTDAAGNSTRYTYYPQGVTGAGKVKSTTLADNSVQFQAYTLRGETLVSWGAKPTQLGSNMTTLANSSTSAPGKMLRL
jgi:YD repeat-containing protein